MNILKKLEEGEEIPLESKAEGRRLAMSLGGTETNSSSAFSIPRKGKLPMVVHFVQDKKMKLKLKRFV